MRNFQQLGLSASINEIIETLGFNEPTPIQEKSIPLLLSKDPTDFIGLAQTGTGKTAAFGLPLVDLIDERQETQAIIMSPTRELGQQTAKQLLSFTQNNPAIKVVAVYGGAAIVNQIKSLRKAPQIIVATPGRLIDLLKRKAVNIDSVKYVILDEADEMLNMGFKEEIDTILSYTPDERVTWLFSATMPKEIRRIVKRYMANPIEVSVNTEEKSNKDIAHKYVVTTSANKIPAIRRFLDIQPEMRGIMFCRTKIETQEIADQLGNLGYGVEALHGDLSQGQRDAVMKRFKARSMQLLIATDVAARGIDVNDLTHVIHHKLPDQIEGYTHRSGRTGRAGKKGVSLVIINPRERNKIKTLEKQIGISFEPIEIPSRTELKKSRINHWADLIVGTKVDAEADEILSALHGQFAHLTKEDILKRLITTQLDHLSGQPGSDRFEEDDLNEQAGETGKLRSNQNSGTGSRYFINLGLIDGLTKSDLAHLISDVSGVDRKVINNISLQKNCSFFDINRENEKGFSDKFNGYEVNGRVIRVNRDDGPGRSENKSKGNKRVGKRGNKSKRNFNRTRKRRI